MHITPNIHVNIVQPWKYCEITFKILFILDLGRLGTPQGLHKDSTRTPVSPCTRNQRDWESTRNPQGVYWEHRESTRNPQGCMGECKVLNKHNEYFSQYADMLVDNHKLFTIEDIASLTSKELAAISRMEFGTASCIIHYASEDTTSLESVRLAG